MQKDEILKLLKAHATTVKAIVDENLCDDSVLMEITTAFENIVNAVTNVFDEGPEYNEVFKHLQNLKDEIEPDGVLELLDESDITDYLIGCGYSVFKIDNLADQMKM